MKSIIYYYSLEGNTKFVSEILAKEIKADTEQIKPVKKNKHQGFLKYFLCGMQVLMKAKPKLVTLKTNPKNYDTIIISTPVWAGSYVPAIRSFLANKKIKNKKIALIACHAGGLGETLYNLKNELEGNKIIASEDFIEAIKNKKSTTNKIKELANKIKS
jgi:flavodoxin